MFDRYDPRDDLRDDSRDDGRDMSRGSRGGASAPDRPDRESRDPFTRDLDLPAGPEREHARDRDRVYDIDGSEARMLATVGAFRVVGERDLAALVRPAVAIAGSTGSARPPATDSGCSFSRIAFALCSMTGSGSQRPATGPSGSGTRSGWKYIRSATSTTFGLIESGRSQRQTHSVACLGTMKSV